MILIFFGAFVYVLRLFDTMDPALDNEDFQQEEFYTKYEPLELLGKLVYLYHHKRLRHVMCWLEVYQVR